MRIGIDIRCLMEKNYSGISEVTYNLLDHLFKIDSTNQYILFYNSSKQPSVPSFDYPNVKFKEYQYPNKLFNLALRYLKITEIDKLIGGVDVFLIPNFLFLNLSKNCRKVLIIHDLSFELYPKFFTLKKRLWHNLIRPKQLCQQADVIIAISENTKNDIIKIYNIQGDKIKVINPGIREVFFQPIDRSTKQKVKQKYHLGDNFILYLGNLEPRKNVDSLIKAFEKINDPTLELAIAGGQAWKYQKTYQLWQNSPLKDKIKFLGYVDTPDKPALYALAKIFVYPSIYEGFGLPPLEAQAVGTPAITSFNSSLVEAVGDSGLLIDPNNINELAQTISQLLGDQNLKNKLIEKGLENVKRFTWKKTSRQVLKILELKKKL